MNAALCWKEYRQQRGLWLAIGGLAVLLIIGIAASLGRGSGLAAFHEEPVRSFLTWLGCSVVLAYGVACGALLLAGDKEDRTLSFLDTLPAPRQALWRGKLASGLLGSVAQGLLLASLGLGLGYLPTDVALSLPLVGADAVVWGLVAGALWSNVLLAVLTGIALLTASWVLPLLLNSATALLVLKLAEAAAGLAWSHWIYCAPERARRLHAEQLGLAEAKRKFAWDRGWAMHWLAVRQGRWVLLGAAAASVVLGLAVNLMPLVLYPAATLLLGLVCGLATFAPEQVHGQQRFLGAQRFPPGKIWVDKVGFWAVAALWLNILLWAVAVGALIVSDSQQASSGYNGRGDYWQDRWFGGAPLDHGFFLFLWLIHGLWLGQFCALWAARPVIAAIVALLLGTAWSLLWLPSVLFGGIAYWQLLTVPIALGLVTRLCFWRWLTGRLYEPGSLIGLGAVAAAAVLFVAGSIRYRVLEIPDVGEPEAVQELIATMPPPEQDEAGPLIRRAGAEFVELTRKADADFAPPGAAAAPEDQRNSWAMLNDVLDEGWKDNPRLARWLDQVCAGSWFKDVHRAARLPLGMIQDPRLLDMMGACRDEFHCATMGTVLGARAAQQAALGKSRETLELIETAFGFSCQMRNHAPAQTFYSGRQLEYAALAVQARWLAQADRDREQLRAALRLLQRQEERRPGDWQVLAANYLACRNSLDREPTAAFGARGPLTHCTNQSVWRLAWQVPWERARQDRLGNLIYQVWLQQAKTPYWEVLAHQLRLREDYVRSGRESWYAIDRGFPPPTGPGADWSPDQWGQLLQRAWPEALSGNYVGMPGGLARLRGQVLTTALVLYQAELGKLPETLQALVPEYLARLPVDPFTGKSFEYRISAGETIFVSTVGDRETALTLQPGQALIRSGRSDAAAHLFPVPMRKQTPAPE